MSLFLIAVSTFSLRVKHTTFSLIFIVEYIMPPRRAKERIPQALRLATWAHWVGPGKSDTLCLCCACNTINCTNFAMGHVESEAHGGQLTIDNLRPICTVCNSSCGTQNLLEFMHKYKLNTSRIENPASSKKCCIIQ